MDNEDLKKAGLKVTMPRLKILQVLAQSTKRHLSAEDVYQALANLDEEIGIATIYRVLTQFEVAGLVSRHNFEGGPSVFELNEGEHHDHLVCVRCGRVQEFVDAIIEERQVAIAKRAGFAMTDHDLNIYGICQKCNEVD